MLYDAFDLQSDIAEQMRGWGRLLDSAWTPWAMWGEPINWMSAGARMMMRAGLTFARPAYGIESVMVGNLEVAVAEGAGVAVAVALAVAVRVTLGEGLAEGERLGLGLAEGVRVKVWLGVALAVAGLMEARARWTGKEPLLTRYTVQLLARTQTYDTEPARMLLGYTPRITVAEGIERTLASLGAP